jgi:hypothetical protein
VSLCYTFRRELKRLQVDPVLLITTLKAGSSTDTIERRPTQSGVEIYKEKSEGRNKIKFKDE